MFKNYTIALASLASMIFACDPPESDNATYRYHPERIEVGLDSPLALVPLFQCFATDEQPARIQYDEAPIVDPGDEKQIHICVSTIGHEDRAQCWRDALIKIGGEVLP